MSDNLISTMQMKQIRNPFGFDFIVEWNKEKARLPGHQGLEGAPWIPLVGPLADHAAVHLYNKVYNQFHDTQVKKIQATQGDKASRSYRVPKQVEDKLWWMITGEHKFPELSQEQVAQEEANLKDLEAAVKQADAASSSGGGISVAALLEQANDEAIAKMGGPTGLEQMSEPTIDSSSGAARLGSSEAVTLGNESLLGSVPAAPEAPVAAASDEFPGLQDLG